MSNPRTLLIEGWRFLPHSYAVVNQFQCLELLRRPDIRLLHRDVPYHQDTWRPVTGIFDPQSEALLRSIPAPAPGDRIDAIYRIAFPYDLSPSPAPRTCVFGTAELGRVPLVCIAGNLPVADAMAANNNIIITPSNWSRDGFLKSGVDPNRVVVIPHGIEPKIYHPIPDDQRQIERNLAGSTGFVFLSVGGMSGNKGMKLLLKAFAAVAAHHPDVMLVLKGLNALYDSPQLLRTETQHLTPAEVALVKPRMRYIGRTLTFENMANLYQTSDAYVAPYYCEGFALPVLEAIACGLPVICTSGGSTDDFTTPDFALRINSHLESRTSPDGGEGLTTVPNLDNLTQHMLTLIEHPEFCTRAHTTGPAFVNENFTWKVVVDRLLQAVFPQ